MDRERAPTLAAGITAGSVSSGGFSSEVPRWSSPHTLGGQTTQERRDLCGVGHLLGATSSVS
jgi:hypothetical protein